MKKTVPITIENPQISSANPDEVTSSLSQRKIEILHKAELYQFNDPLLRGTTNTTNGMAETILKTWEAFENVHKAKPVPKVFELRNFLTVFVGILDVFTGINKFQISSDANYFFGQVEGAAEFVAGLFEIAAGTLKGLLAIFEMVDISGGISKLSQMSIASDFLMSIALFFSSVKQLHHARLAGDLKREIKKCKTQEEVTLLIINQMQSPAGVIRIKKILGNESFDLIKDLKENEKLDQIAIDMLVNNLSKSELYSAIMGTFTLISALFLIAGDIATLGKVNHVISIISPIISGLAMFFDGAEMLEGAHSEKRSKFDYVFLMVLQFLAASMCMAALIVGDLATCGGLSIATFVFISVLPFIFSGYLNKHDISNAVKEIFQNLIKCVLSEKPETTPQAA